MEPEKLHSPRKRHIVCQVCGTRMKFLDRVQCNLCDLWHCEECDGRLVGTCIGCLPNSSDEEDQ